ncbi:TniQ family protein [Herbaspirillum huttiense]|uniref:TniQ family protein n=1 Tax=Herbaspirillum huttiense TaxID=863372 RepID=UPI00141705CC|nr:TniQ family protein [Herbaspirillum huttiense]
MKKVLLPYCPGPYPGEIVGSWLSRLKAHNTQGIWGSLLTEFGVQNYSFISGLDLAEYSPRVKALLEFLGVSNTEALAEHSTTPFHLALCSTPTKGRSRQLNALRYYCHICMEQDIDLYGEPYWHTEHQIKNVRVCRKHTIALSISCPNCNLKVGYNHLDLPTPLTHICHCGTDRRNEKSKSINKDHLLHRLSVFSYEALQERHVDWTQEQVLGYLKSRINHRRQLTELFDRDWHCHDEIKMNWSSTEPLKKLSAHAISAALVSWGLDYPTATDEFRRFNVASSSNEPALRLTPHYKIKSLQCAKDSMIEFRRRNPHLIPSHNKPAYEFLRIHDPKWLLTIGSRITEIPSIESDRAKILSAFNNGKNPHGATEFFRAQFRDSTWYKKIMYERKVRTSSQRSERMKAVSASVSNERIALIESAIATYVESSFPPRKITAENISLLTGLTNAQIGIVMKRNAALQEARDNANIKLTERHIVRVFDALSDEKTDFSVTSLAAKCGIFSNPANLNYIITVLKNHGRACKYHSKKFENIAS